MYLLGRQYVSRIRLERRVIHNWRCSMSRFLKRLAYARRNYERRRTGRLAVAGRNLLGVAAVVAVLAIVPGPMMAVGLPLGAAFAAIGVALLATIFLAPIGLLLL